MSRLLTWIAAGFCASSMNRTKKSGSLLRSTCVKRLVWGSVLTPVLLLQLARAFSLTASSKRCNGAWTPMLTSRNIADHAQSGQPAPTTSKLVIGHEDRAEREAPIAGPGLPALPVCERRAPDWAVSGSMTQISRMRFRLL